MTQCNEESTKSAGQTDSRSVRPSVDRRAHQWPVGQCLQYDELGRPPAAPRIRHAAFVHSREYDASIRRHFSNEQVVEYPVVGGSSLFRATRTVSCRRHPPCITTALDSGAETDNCLSAEHPTRLFEINLVRRRRSLRSQKPIFVGDGGGACVSRSRSRRHRARTCYNCQSQSQSRGETRR